MTHTAIHTGWAVRNPEDTGGCYTCRHGSLEPRPFCEKHRIVPSLPENGCAGREREVGSDDEPFWRRDDA